MIQQLILIYCCIFAVSAITAAAASVLDFNRRVPNRVPNGVPNRRVPNRIRNTHYPWGHWGRCVPPGVQFRRRMCRISFESVGQCRDRFERRNCSIYSSIATPVSANLSSFDCGKSRNRNVILRIIGGTESTPHSWPWHVSLVKSGSPNNRFCGGTLIHPQFVLTARHCVYSDSTRRFDSHLLALVGDHDNDRQPKEQLLPVSKVLLNPRTNMDNLEFDVALLELKRPAVLNEHVGVACIARLGQSMANVPAGTVCTAIGHGRVSEAWKIPVSGLREVKLKVQSNWNCSRTYRMSNVRIKSRIHMCAGGRAAGDTCKGDSGGGLFCREAGGGGGGGGEGKWFVQGVTSFGHPMGCGVSAGVYQRVPAIAKWLQDTISKELR